MVYNPFSRICWLPVGATLLLSPPQLHALPDYWHTVVIKNTTGATANDLHVNLVHPAVGDPVGPAFPTITKTADSKGIDFSGAGGIPNGSSTGISWQSEFASDSLDPANPGFWTFNGANIGNITVTRAVAMLPQIDNLPSGPVITVAVNNMSSSPLQFSGLQVYTGADLSTFNGTDYLTGMTSGVLALSVASGTLSPGVNTLGSFTLSPFGYTAGQMLVEGDLVGLGGAVPEPATYVLVGVALLALIGLKRVAHA
jgi:hypothetical protein